MAKPPLGPNQKSSYSKNDGGAAKHGQSSSKPKDEYGNPSDMSPFKSSVVADENQASTSNANSSY